MRTPAEYEEFVAQVLREIGEGYDVVSQKTFVGRRSGRKIRVDAAFAFPVSAGAQILVIVECKHYRSKVGVGDVEEFHSKLDDIGAHKGIMVTTVGYQDGAMRTAKSRGIALATLTDQSLPGELAYVSASAVAPCTLVSPRSDKMLQGNFRPWAKMMGHWWDDGLRFDSFENLWTYLYLSLDDYMDGPEVAAAAPR